MKTLVFNDPRVFTFIKERCGTERLAGAVTIGIAEDGQIIGGFAATDMYAGVDIMCHIAGTESKNWATRRFFRAIFRYLFVQLGSRRCTALVERSNNPSRRLVERLGYQQEGVLRQRGANGGDVIVYGMLRKECRWIEGDFNV